jgi:hypothetical protein
LEFLLGENWKQKIQDKDYSEDLGKFVNSRQELLNLLKENKLSKYKEAMGDLKNYQQEYDISEKEWLALNTDPTILRLQNKSGGKDNLMSIEYREKKSLEISKKNTMN